MKGEDLELEKRSRLLDSFRRTRDSLGLAGVEALELETLGSRVFSSTPKRQWEKWSRLWRERLRGERTRTDVGNETQLT